MKKGEDAAVDAIANLFTAQTGVEIRSNRLEVVKSRLASRLRNLRLTSFEEYVDYLSEKAKDEMTYVVSCLTTHRTEFFREAEQIEHFVQHTVVPLIDAQRPIRVWSAGTSTGEESYSLAIAIAEALMKKGLRPKTYLPGFQIVGTDVDVKCLQHASNGVYSSRIVQAAQSLQLQRWLQKGKADLSKFYRICDEIHRHCIFKAHNLIVDDPVSYDFDAIFCRNVFIYFTRANIQRALRVLTSSLRPGGMLYVGCTEPLEEIPLGLERRSQSAYQLKTLPVVRSSAPGVEHSKYSYASAATKIKVLIVDDARTVRAALRQALEGSGLFEVVADVGGTRAARDVLQSQSVDVMTLDINMPEESGISYLEKLHASGTMDTHPPVVIVSSLNPEDAEIFLRCEQLGAVAYLEKPAHVVKQVAVGFVETLAMAAGKPRPVAKELWLEDRRSLERELLNASSNPRPFRTLVSAPLARHTEAILIGASTGGTVALAHILKGFPPSFAPVVVAQHIPTHFIDTLARNLYETTGKRVVLAEHGADLQDNTVCLIPGLVQGRLVRKSSLVIDLRDEPAFNGHKPSVDVLFHSAARIISRKGFVALLLTGMGNDGARGLLSLRQAGASTICQDKSSCIVFGMPRAAIDLGAAEYVLPLHRISQSLFGTHTGNPGRHVESSR